MPNERWRDTYDAWKLACPYDDWDDEEGEEEEEELDLDQLYEEWIEQFYEAEEDVQNPYPGTKRRRQSPLLAQDDEA